MSKKRTPDQPMREHLEELRKRLTILALGFCVAFGVCILLSENIFQLLVRPLADLLEEDRSRRLIYTGLTETFTTYLKVALFSAIFLVFPLLAIQVWRFIAPGLYKREKYIFLSLLCATPFLFLLGASFAYGVIIPLAWKFFLAFETVGSATTLPIQLEARVSEYLSLVMHLLFAFGLSFQLPVGLVIFSRLGILTGAGLARNRKYALLFLMIAAAFLTPPDILSMLGLTVPLYLLYELSIYLVGLIERRLEKR